MCRSLYYIDARTGGWILLVAGILLLVFIPGADFVLLRFGIEMTSASKTMLFVICALLGTILFLFGLAIIIYMWTSEDWSEIHDETAPNLPPPAQ